MDKKDDKPELDRLLAMLGPKEDSDVLLARVVEQDENPLPRNLQETSDG